MKCVTQITGRFCFRVHSNKFLFYNHQLFLETEGILWRVNNLVFKYNVYVCFLSTLFFFLVIQWSQNNTIIYYMFDFKAIWLTLFDHILILSETDTIISLVLLTIWKLYHLSNDACYIFYLLLMMMQFIVIYLSLLLYLYIICSVFVCI